MDSGTPPEGLEAPNTWHGKKNPALKSVQAGFLLNPKERQSRFGNVNCLKALGALLHFKLHRVPLVKRLVPVSHDGLIMHEHVFAGASLDKAVALRIIEPFDCTLLHMDTSHIEFNMYTGTLSLTVQEEINREADVLLVSCEIQKSEADTSDGRTASSLGRSAASIDAVETRNGAVSCESKIPTAPERIKSGWG